jgi:hypothetical protein
VGNPIWGFGRREAHQCGLMAAVSSAEGRAPMRCQRSARQRGWRGTPGGGGAKGSGEGADLARVDRSMRIWPG